MLPLCFTLFYSILFLPFFPIGRRSTRSGEVTRIFRNIFTYVLFCIGLLDGSHPRLWSFVLAFLLCPRMASAAAAATLGPCKESLRWIWTLPSAPRVKSSFRHELLQTVYIHINDVYILEPLELENYSTTVNLKATCQLWYFKFAFRNMSCVH